MKRGPRKKVSVLYAPGTNCEEETMEAIRLAGGKPQLILLDDIYKERKKITDCDAFVDPGGFSYGDHLEAGVAVAVLLEDHFSLLKESGIPMLGICNGDQTLVRSKMFIPGIAMVENKSKVFCSRPIKHRVLLSNCVWTQGLEGRILTFPAAHRYGRFLIKASINLVMEYEGISPNGGAVAMICDDTGRIAVLMDHPERPPDNPDGLEIFRRGIDAA